MIKVMIEFEDYIKRKIPKIYGRYPFLVWFILVIGFISFMITLKFLIE